MQKYGLVILHSADKYIYSGALKLSANHLGSPRICSFLALKDPIKSSSLPLTDPQALPSHFLHKTDRMSSSVNNNHSNGPSNESGRPNNSFPTAHLAQNSTFLLSKSILISQCKGNTGEQASPAPSQATANGSSQGSNGPTLASYTGLLSQNGKHLLNFYSTLQNI